VREIAQERWTYATVPLGPDSQVGQSFVARTDGLQAIEVMAARYRPDETLPSSAQIRLVLERLDRPERTPTVVTRSIALVENNALMRFAFPTEPDSAGGLYRFTLRSDVDHGIGVWASAHEALAGGELYANGVAMDGDLLFYTHHAYPLTALLRNLPGILAPWVGLLAAAALALGLPGMALLAWARPRGPVDAMLCAAWLLALGLAFWPLLLLWTTALGLPLTAPGAWGVLLALAVLSAAGWLRGARHGSRLRVAPLGGSEAALLAVLAVAIVVRLVQARAQIVPLWVDGVHHTMVTQLIVEQGVVPRTGEPYISIAGFHYHFGFHAVAAALSWLAGLAPYRAVLGLGQLLSGLAGLPLYALTTRALAGRRTRPSLRARWAGVIAAAVPSFLTYMPAYYISWARYTQLAGLVILPVLLATTLDLLEGPRRLRPWVSALLLVAGLALTHYRVLVFYMVFWLVYGLSKLIDSAARRAPLAETLRPCLLRGLALATGALLLIAPWIVRMVTAVLLPFGTIYGQWAAPAGADTSVPLGLLRVEGTLWVLAAAGLGWAWALARRRWRVALFGVWAAACVLISDVTVLGLRGTWFLHGTSAAISYWVPAGILIGWLAGDLALTPARLLRGCVGKRRTAMGVSAAMLVGAVALSVGSVWGQVDRVNPSTVLLRESDLPAVAWVRDNLPADSLILINTRPWLGEIRRGSDAGWWLPYLTGHRVTYPAVLYTHGEPAYRDPISALATAVDTADSLDDPALLQLLAEAGVTHLFVGTGGGPLEPKRLAAPHYVEAYRDGPTRVYRFVPTAH
jgi:hypothetical protein